MPSTTRNNNNNNNNNNEPVTFNDHHTNKIKRVNKKDDESKLTLQWLITVGFLGWAIAMTVFYVQETKANGSARTGININADKESNDNNNNNNNNNDIADPLIVRAALKDFVDSLDDDSSILAYHSNLTDQNKDYNFCTIAQQCSNSYYMLSLDEMTGRQRGLVYTALSTILMSPESFSLLQLQHQSNMMLGEMMQTGTATTSSCDDDDGTCRLLRDPDGLLPYNYNLNTNVDEYSTFFGAISSDDCYDLYKNGTQTFWYCNNDEPRSMHQGQVNVETGQYYMGNSWEQPYVQQDYFSVYGNLDLNTLSYENATVVGVALGTSFGSEDGFGDGSIGGFGVRFSGHHIDINYQWDKDGRMIQATPVFINTTFECMDSDSDSDSDVDPLCDDEPPQKKTDDDDREDPDDNNNSTRLRG